MGANAVPSDPDRPIRHYPHRFGRSSYQLAWYPVNFTVRVRTGSGDLTQDEMARTTADTMEDSAADRDCSLIAWCVMPDHVHMLVCATDAGGDVQSFIELFKRRSARRLSKLGMVTPVWQKRYWDRHIRSGEDLDNVIEYLLMNPVREGLCDQPEDWPHSAFCGFPWTDSREQA